MVVLNSVHLSKHGSSRGSVVDFHPSSTAYLASPLSSPARVGYLISSTPLAQDVGSKHWPVCRPKINSLHHAPPTLHPTQGGTSPILKSQIKLNTKEYIIHFTPGFKAITHRPSGPQHFPTFPNKQHPSNTGRSFHTVPQLEPTSKKGPGRTFWNRVNERTIYYSENGSSKTV